MVSIAVKLPKFDGLLTVPITTSTPAEKPVEAKWISICLVPLSKPMIAGLTRAS